MGVLALVMFTPVYEHATQQPLLHSTPHLHYLAAGCVSAWSIAGPDPSYRAPVAVGISVLVAASGAHAAIAKYIYAHADTLSLGDHGGIDAVRRGAQLMYYGGDVAEVVLAIALFAAWYRHRGVRFRLDRASAFAASAS